ncbi:MAG: DUF1801 domain-containing protein [Thermomicrobiales bacterium]|nr:DUF1801 domain-containing protein [Thermomicrobiales bacterium]
MTEIADHDAYIAAAPEQFQPSLRHLRELLARTLPDAEEIMAYNMPGFRIGDTIVAGYAAFSKQCGLYVQGGCYQPVFRTHRDCRSQGSQDRCHLLAT